MKENRNEMKENRGEERPGEMGGGERIRQNGGERRGRRKFVILTDSNAKGVTPDVVMSHIPKDERNNLDIRIDVP